MLVMCHAQRRMPFWGRAHVSLPVQYSAASFIETINSGSLTMDPDEFLAHMVAAGVADMPAASPRASAARATSPAFAASAAEDVAVLPPPAGQLPHPPASSAGMLLDHLYTLLRVLSWQLMQLRMVAWLHGIHPHD